jgi:hypothetical protein
MYALKRPYIPTAIGWSHQVSQGRRLRFCIARRGRRKGGQSSGPDLYSTTLAHSGDPRPFRYMAGTWKPMKARENGPGVRARRIWVDSMASCHQRTAGFYEERRRNGLERDLVSGPHSEVLFPRVDIDALLVTDKLV